MPSEPKQTRALLKAAFSENAAPTPADFAALIDANLNQPDDGIDITGNTISITKAVRATQGLAVAGGELTVGTAGSVGANNTSLKVHAQITANGLVTANAGLTAAAKVTAANGLEVTAGATTIGSATNGLSATIYNTLTVASSTAAGVATPGSLKVDSITPSNTGANANLALAGKGTGSVDVMSPLRVDSISPSNAATNADLTLAGKGTGKVAVTGPLAVGSPTAGASATIYSALTIAQSTAGTVTTPSTLKVDSIGPSTLDTTNNGSLTLAAKGTGKVNVTSPIVVGSNSAAVATTLYSSLTIAQSTATTTVGTASTTITSYGALNVDSISPSNTDPNVDLSLAGKGTTGRVKITSPLAVDTIKPSNTGLNADLTLAGNASGSVAVTSALKVGAEAAPVVATIYNTLSILPGRRQSLVNGAVTTEVMPSALSVDAISASSTDTNLSLSGNGTGYVTTNSLQVNGTLWVGSSASKQSATISDRLYVDTISSTTDNTNIALNPQGTGVVDVQRPLTVSAGNLTVSAGDLTIGQSGGAPRTLTVYGNLVVVGSIGGGAVWTVATLASTNSNNTAPGFSKVSYCKDTYEIVRLRGSVNVSSNSYQSSDGMYLVCTLPQGYRPTYPAWFPVTYGSGTSRSTGIVTIKAGGQVYATGYGAYYDLDGISFQAGPPPNVLDLPLSGNVTDRSTASNTGTATAITWESDSKFGQCAVFNGTTSKIDFPQLTCGREFTFALWVKRAVDNPSTWAVLLEYGNDSPEFILHSQIPTLYPGGGAGSGVLDAGKWYHLAATQDMAEVRLYVNGALNKAVAGCSSYGGFGLGIGNHVGDSYFKGRMARVLIYDRALTASEITALYNA